MSVEDLRALILLGQDAYAELYDAIEVIEALPEEDRSKVYGICADYITCCCYGDIALRADLKIAVDELLSSKIDFDEYTTPEIDTMITEGKCTEEDVVAFYNNEFWRDVA